MVQWADYAAVPVPPWFIEAFTLVFKGCAPLWVRWVPYAVFLWGDAKICGWVDIQGGNAYGVQCQMKMYWMKSLGFNLVKFGQICTSLCGFVLCIFHGYFWPLSTATHQTSPLFLKFSPTFCPIFPVSLCANFDVYFIRLNMNYYTILWLVILHTRNTTK